jgi:hypothetical protein
LKTLRPPCPAVGVNAFEIVANRVAEPAPGYAITE